MLAGTFDEFPGSLTQTTLLKHYILYIVHFDHILVFRYFNSFSLDRCKENVPMSTITFQIISDLHLKTPKARPTYDDFEIQPQSKYLALLGDIGNAGDPRLFAFLERQLRQFEIVFFLLGNHEPFGMTISEAKTVVRNF